MLPSAPTLAAEPSEVAWLAGLLGAEPGELPATLALAELRLGPAGVEQVLRDAPVAEVAALARAAGQAEQAPEVPAFLGAGERAPGLGGIAWNALVVGPLSLGCITMNVTSTPLRVPPNAVNPGGPINLSLHAEVPQGTTFLLSASATMQVMVLPQPKLGPVSVRALAVDMPVFVGFAYVFCSQGWTTRVTFATIHGDGVVQG